MSLWLARNAGRATGSSRWSSFLLATTSSSKVARDPSGNSWIVHREKPSRSPVSRASRTALRRITTGLVRREHQVVGEHGPAAQLVLLVVEGPDLLDLGPPGGIVGQVLERLVDVAGRRARCPDAAKTVGVVSHGIDPRARWRMMETGDVEVVMATSDPGQANRLVGLGIGALAPIVVSLILVPVPAGARQREPRADPGARRGGGRDRRRTRRRGARRGDGHAVVRLLPHRARTSRWTSSRATTSRPMLILLGVGLLVGEMAARGRRSRARHGNAPRTAIFAGAPGRRRDRAGRRRRRRRRHA